MNKDKGKKLGYIVFLSTELVIFAILGICIVNFILNNELKLELLTTIATIQTTTLVVVWGAVAGKNVVDLKMNGLQIKNKEKTNGETID